MTKQKRNVLQIYWVALLIVLIVLLGAFVFFKENSNPKPSQSTSYQVYQNSEYNFSLKYPEAWEMRNDSQAFENGDIVSFHTTGPAQRPRTELTDGARFSIAVPFVIATDLKSWLKDNFSSKAEFSQIEIGGVTFEQVGECYINCPTYFYTRHNGKIFGIAILAAGNDSIKMVYDSTLVTMLKSFKFSKLGNQLSEADALSKVKAQTEVKEYLKRVPGGLVAVNGDDDTNYMVQVYELKDGHTATYNWYTVNKQTGKITEEFDN